MSRSAKQLFSMMGVVSVSLLLAAACTSGSSPSAAPPEPAAPAAKQAEKPESEKPTGAGEQTTPKQAEAKSQPAAAEKGGSESIEALYEKAKQEGTITLYGTLNPNTTAVIFPAFEQRFPGVKVSWVEGTDDKLMSRLIAEARGGKVLADVMQTNVEPFSQIDAQGLLLDWSPPEAAAYPESLKQSNWTASDLKFWVIGWNTNRVEESEAPKTFEDLADPKWQGKLLADQGDFELLLGLAKQKYDGNDEQAIQLMEAIAANKPEFHSGHSEIVELLAAGQKTVCFTCFSHHFPPRLEAGAPVGYSLEVGLGRASGNAILKGAPHPNAAKLFVRWVASKEGQQAYAEAGATPAHPDVAPVEEVRPETIYAVRPADVKEFDKYQEMWNEIFGLR